ncbi:E3 ubiquitin-protein ligase [Cricetulus griseus]|nr:E3 ubiquitin-protein ligase [Cricetulus griseus]
MGFQEAVGSSGTGVTDSCELPCGCWELNPGPLEEEPGLLTTEPYLQPVETEFLCVSLAVLELTLLTRLASNSEICLPLPPEC